MDESCIEQRNICILRRNQEPQFCTAQHDTLCALLSKTFHDTNKLLPGGIPDISDTQFVKNDPVCDLSFLFYLFPMSDLQVTQAYYSDQKVTLSTEGRMLFLSILLLSHHSIKPGQKINHIQYQLKPGQIPAQLRRNPDG